MPLAEVVASLGRHAEGIEATPEPEPPEAVPDWIRNGLLATGATLEDIAARSADEALAELQKRWSSR